jgi:hypothetical protein
MSLLSWFRSNSEYYLMCDAQNRMARQMGYNPPAGPRNLRERFWRQVFVPAYRILPDGVRIGLIKALPGSHRQSWPKRSTRGPMPM